MVHPRRPARRPENARLRAYERRLLCRRQLDHPPVLVRPEGREDLAADPEVRMAHVRVFRRFGKTERQAPELGCGHALPPAIIRRIEPRPAPPPRDTP